MGKTWGYKIEWILILPFYINHNNIEVYVDGHNVYSLDGIDDRFRTSGGTWVMVPPYTLSIISLMVIALAMLNCVELSENRPNRKKVIQIFFDSNRSNPE